MFTSLRRAALVVGAALSVLAGTALVAPAAWAVSGEASVTTAARAVQPAAGNFTASVDFSTLRTRDVLGNKCELTVSGALTFTGSLVGVAEGKTTAVIFAPCSEVTTTPPGTYFDVFRFEGTFTGTVNGFPVTRPLSYVGITRVGGAIDALIILDGGGARAVLRADATIAVGGSYSGVARTA